MNQIFNPPVEARIREDKYGQYSATLSGMGLLRQQFRVAARNETQVFVHPDDTSKDGSLAIRAEFVEFIGEC